MINLTTLYTGGASTSDDLRYGMGAHTARSGAERRPVVVWNSTRKCNLSCRHCYSNSHNMDYPNELTTEEAKAFLTDIIEYKVPALLLSGGEPLIRPDLDELLAFARERGLKVTISTNGTLITPERAARFAQLGVTYVGVSLDGIGRSHDLFRGHIGTFEAARNGIRSLKTHGVRTGIRVTLARPTIAQLDALFMFAEEEHIDRVCFYHLVPVGRGRQKDLLPPDETRAAVDRILAWTKDLAARDMGVEVLTVDGHFDGAYLVERLFEENPERAEAVLTRLQWNGGAFNSTGRGIACVNWEGQVHPDQFMRNVVVGNIRERPFSEIWSSESVPFLEQLRHKRQYLHGRCTGCRFLEICGGGLRARADAAGGDVWAPDPACYLTDEEISA